MDYCIFLAVCFAGCLTEVFGVEPSFDVPVINVTVQEGDTAVLPCSVDFLGEHKVVWTDQWSTLLTLDDRRIIDDPRISIERPFTRDWNLHVRKTAYSDRGQYTCQINTNPVKTKTVMLIVLVPSKIINSLSSGDQTVREGDKVTLVCNVTGVPIPDVTWFRLPNEGLQTKERIGTTGEVLIIHNVSRYCDGIYECVAYNNVDPAVTRQIKVFVEFAPEVSLPTKKIGQYVGRETILDCEITAYPHGVMYWMKDERQLEISKNKYQVEVYGGTIEGTRKTLSLRVKDIEIDDFGEYTCFAQNIIGSDRESMILYDYAIHTTRHKTTTARPILIEPTPKLITNIPTNQIGQTYGDRNGSKPPWTSKDVTIPEWIGNPIKPQNPGLENAALGSSRGGARHSYATLSALYSIIIGLTVKSILTGAYCL